ncbi:NAD-dependent epimerase/dehydratase family protein [Seonamhaeicola sp. NFXS20]|uniref:NAD-dependent epimerase/dehydratase family protein n=1 Tax=Seonamhaeicola sp. NFXS20 TaxID=2816959 RepID=UPI003B8BA664
MKKIGIIGGSGFIGSHVTKIFLNKGYQVKVSTTDISREDKYGHLMTLKHADNLYISEMDITNKTSLKEFVSDCDIIVHGGTPFILDVTDPQTQLFNPTIEGTKNFLEVISLTPSIEKVVFIASVAGWNTNFPFPPNGKNFTDTIDESCSRFSSTESHPYAQAKFIANQVVEKFINNNPNIHFEISTVSPVAVMGKALSNRKDSTSGNLQYLVKNNIAPNNFIKFLFDNDVPFAIVDVEDVAKAIYKIATKKGLHGKDYLLSSETYKISDMHKMLNHKPAKNHPQIIYKNDLIKTDLGIYFKPAKDSLNSFSN